MRDPAPSRQVEEWLALFSRALADNDGPAAAQLFVEDCFWRDVLAFTWNIKTMEGRDAISTMLAATLRMVQPSGWRVVGNPVVHGEIVEAWLVFETDAARGEGIVRLRGDRCHTLFTAVRDLKGFEEKRGTTRPRGVRHRADPDRETWSEARARVDRTLGYDEQPYVVVVGGGQGGMALGARLKQLGVPAIVLEKNARAGDSWRNRYRTLVLHDPVWYDHLPYIPFPEHWPVFTPKDQMGDWLEMYARVMELNYWTDSTCVRAAFDPARKGWTLEVRRKDETVVLRPKHLVFATGAYGPPRMIELPGRAEFPGEVLHSSQYADGSRFRGKRVAVLGAASSGHDVSVDLWESGAHVTMLQRSATTVVKSDTLMEMAFAIYSEEALAQGVTTEKADMLAASVPFGLMPRSQKALYDGIRARDADFYRQLEAAGFAVDFGEDDSGLMMKAYRTGSGYYIDVGASDLIISGKIAVRSGVGVTRLTGNGLLLDDGSEVAADAVIACTGYQSMHETVAGIVSRDVADRIGPCWGLGSGVRGDPGPWRGEPRNMWKPTAQEALWFHGGNLALSRFYSKYVALQLKARMEGLATPVYGEPG